MKPCILYKKEKNKLRCLACAHKCLIDKDKTGICSVRKNIKGKLMLLVYNRVVSMNVDPIEKKPFYKFLPGTKSFSIGTVGCNLACSWCQNYDISQASKYSQILGKEISAEEVVNQAIVNGCRSISYTYNEPMIWVEFVRDVAKIAREKGLKNIMVTNGYWSEESFDFIKDYIDAVNIDLKAFNENTYKKFCGGKVDAVLDTIKKCYKAGIHVEVTTLIIPGINDSNAELEKIARFISSVDENIVWHISRYFPMYKMKKEITPKSTLEKAKKIGEKYLKFVYVGNV